MSKNIDYEKIFIKDACPTSIGGQAVMEGVMMQGPHKIALAMRLPSGELYLKTRRKPTDPPAMKVPVLRGVVAFVRSLTTGMKTLMESADILEAYAPEQYAEETGRFETWLNNKIGQKATWNLMMTFSLILALVITIVGFVIFPTWLINLLSGVIKSSVLLNLLEGILRIILFVLYVLAIRKLDDIKTLFQYHGAEHKSIHCYENNLELTPDNADQFYTLHPRCGTSFLVFVLIISLLLFSFLGWPSLFWRITSRIILIPVIAGLSYELLKWAGRCDNHAVRILSYPGLMLQKLTTAEPNKEQLEVALLALKAVLAERSTPSIAGFVDADGNLIDQFKEDDFIESKEKPEGEENAPVEANEAAPEELALSPENEEKPETEALDPGQEAEAIPLVQNGDEAGLVDTIDANEDEIPHEKITAGGILESAKGAFAKLIKKKEELEDEEEIDLTPLSAGENNESEQSEEKKKEAELKAALAGVGDLSPALIKYAQKKGLMGAADQAAASAEEQTKAAGAEVVSVDEASHTLKSALKWGQEQLAGIENGSYDATQMFRYLTGLSTSRIITRAEEALDQEKFAEYKTLIEKRLEGIPMQYLTGVQEFMRLEFNVNPKVLIPRFDTEILAQKTINVIASKKLRDGDFLDLCTGSGILGVTLAHEYKNAEITMTDISEDALKIAVENAKKHKVLQQCKFIVSNMFDLVPEGKEYDVIISNPPYIETEVIETLATEVKDHEPRIALDGGQDGLKFYRIIAAEAGKHLRTGGILALEIGADQNEAVYNLLKQSGDYRAIASFKDLAGLDRVIMAERK